MSRLPSPINKKNPTTIASARPSSRAANRESSIPKSRSLSQPRHLPITAKEQPSRLITFNQNEDSLQELHNTLLDCDLLMDHNLICEEFKDCLGGVKLELGYLGEFTSNMGDKTAEEILNSLKMTEELDIINANRIEAKITNSNSEAPGTSKQANDSKKVESKLRKPSPNISNKFPKKCTTSSRELPRKKSNSAIPISMSATQKLTATKTKPSSAPTNSPPKQPHRFGSSKASSISGPSGKKPSNLPGTSGQKPKLPSVIPSSNTNADRLMGIFTCKKKRYDSLRKDLESQHKPIQELHTALMELKKVLEENGKTVAVIESNPFETGFTHVVPDVDKGTACEQESSTPVVLGELKITIDEIRSNSVELCKKMVDKRKELLFACQNIAENNNCTTCNHGAQLLLELEEHRKENAALEAFMHESIFNLDSTLREMLAKLTQVAHRSGDSECINALQDYKEYDNKIKTLERQLSNAQQDIKILEAARDTNAEKADVLQRENGKLTNKIALIEKNMEGEKKRAAHEIEKYKVAETTLKTLRGKMKDLELQKSQHDDKVNHLNQDIKNSQMKMKQMERNFEKEVYDLNKARNVDKAVIEQLTKDKTSFEARLAKREQVLDSTIKARDEEKHVLQQELEFERDACNEQRKLVEEIRLEMEKLKQENETLKARPTHSKDLLKMNELIKGRENELQNEVSALRAEIKILQEEVQEREQAKTCIMEKMTKIDDEASAKMRKDLEILLAKKNEEITKIRVILQVMEEELSSNRAENETLKGELNNLRVYFDSLKQETSNERDFKCMIKEGRSKLEEALMKSVDNEHKMIKYEKELNYKKQYIAKLEATVKSRENVIKSLHDDMDRIEKEKASLNTYSNEVQRHADEELAEKIIAIKSLDLQLRDQKEEMSKLLNHIHHLESVLMLTNEKRFKLQDAVCYMDRELHNRDINNVLIHGDIVGASGSSRGTPESVHNVMVDGGPRSTTTRFSDSVSVHSDGGVSDDVIAVDSFIGLRRWTAASASLYNEFKTQYQNSQAAAAGQWPLAQAMSSTSTLTQIEETSFKTISTLSDESMCVSPHDQHDAHFVFDSIVNYNTYQNVNPFDIRTTFNTFGGHSAACNVDPAIGYQPSYSRIDNFNIVAEPSRRALVRAYVPSVPFPGVPNTGSVAWLETSPSRSANIGAGFISHDAFAHRCAQIKNNLECSMRRLNNARYPFQFAAASGQ